ncbi:MAG: hypothetical protein LBS97_00885 [Treponema sp.]|nr:hypothetical protein [Treponema sp.]
MKTKKFVLFLAAGLAFASLPLWAEEEGITSSTDMSFTVSSLPEAKLAVTQGFVFPFLRGENPLTAGNNVSMSVKAEISPISLNEVTEIVWTPIAFLQVVVGERVGTGWNINLFGGDIYGIGINREKANKSGGVEIDASPFDGVLWQVKGGGVFQFDMAAIVPGDWNHVVFRTYHEVNYAGYSRAETGESWYFENDAGENRNGWNYYGNFLLGYQMPIFLDTVGFMAETGKNLYGTENGDIWGDNLARWTLSLLCNFTVTPKFSVALITQFNTVRKFVESNSDDLFYQNRHIDDPARVLDFYRVAAIMNLKLR